MTSSGFLHCCALLCLSLLFVPGLPAQSVVLSQGEGVRGHSPDIEVLAANAGLAAGPAGQMEVSERTVHYRSHEASWSEILSHPDAGAGFFRTGRRAGNETTSFVRNPRAVFDRLSQRFFVVAVEIRSVDLPGGTPGWTHYSFLHIAVSRNAHPARGDWDFFLHSTSVTDGEFGPLDERGGLSEPVPGVDGMHLYVSGTLRRMEGNGSGNFTDRGELAIYAVPKTALLTGQPIAPKVFRSTDSLSAVPAMAVNPPAAPVDAWFVSLDGNALNPSLRLHYFDELATNFRHDYDLTEVEGNYVTVDARQPSNPAPPGGWPQGEPVELRGGEPSGLSAVRAGNHFWVTWAGLDDGRSVIHWAKLHPGPIGSGETILDAQGTIDAGGDRENFAPGIGANPNGDLCLVWAASSAATAPGVWYSVRTVNGGWESPRLLKQSARAASLTPYEGSGLLAPGRAHWGIAATVTTDPRDNNFVVAQEYSRSPALDDRALWWARISPCPLPVVTAMGPASPAIAVKGGTLALSATTAGSYLSSRWEHDPSLAPEWGTGTTVPGSVNALNFHRTGLLLEHRGKYRLVFTTPCGTLVFSESLRVEVAGPPEVLHRPGQQHICPGESTWFQISAEAERLDYEHLAEFPVPLTVEWRHAGEAAPCTGSVIQPGSALHQVLDEDELIRQNHALILPIVSPSHGGVWRARLTNIAGTTETAPWLLETRPRFRAFPAAPAGAVACGSPVTLRADFLGVSGGTFASVPGTSLKTRRPADLSDMQITWRHRGVPVVSAGRFRIEHDESFEFDAAAGESVKKMWSILTITDPDFTDEGDYDCVLTDACGPAGTAVFPATWLQLQPTPPWLTLTASGPDPRDGHGLIYDSARRETVLFGGEAFGYSPKPGQPAWHGRYPSNDTFTWDGFVWTKKEPAHRPPPLRDFSLAWDRARERVVLFGGSRTDAAAPYNNETWEWDGTDWAQRLPATLPPPRQGASMCYDSIRGETLMIGGDIAGGDYYAERKKLWAWNGTDWTVRDTGFVGHAQTVPYYGPAFVFDERRGVAVLYDRVQKGSVYVIPEWNGTAWEDGVVPHPGAYGGAGRGGFYDPWRRQVTITGGSASAGHTDPALMHYDGSGWRGEVPATRDGVTGSLIDPLLVRPQSAWEVAFDTHRRRYVWFDSPTPFYSGPAFTRETVFHCRPEIAHLPRSVNVQTGQMAQIRVIAAGLPDLSFQWRRNGTALSDGGNILGSRSPVLQILNASAADAAVYSVTISNPHGQVTGGGVPVTVTGPALTDTALCTGAPCGDTPNPHTPPVVLSVSAPGTGTLLLDGTGAGPLPAAPVAFSWRHNGISVPGDAAVLSLTNPDYPHEGEWELFAMTSGAPASQRLLRWWRVAVTGALPYITLQDNGAIPRLTDAAMAWDSRRGVTVIFGGTAYGTIPGTQQTGTFISRQTWEWDGTGWLLRTPAVSPPPLDQAGMVYDARRGRMVLFGGRKFSGTAAGSASAVSGETWEYDGLTWMQAAPQTSPPAVTRPSMCFDTVRGETLMIGGDIQPLASRHVLWGWNGLNWTARSALLPVQGAAGPIELYGANAMAFDESRGVAVLFGSLSGNSSDFDVLEWDGTWWRHTTPEAPAPGDYQLRDTLNATAFYDPFRRMTGIAGAVSFAGEKSLRYWDGKRYFSGTTTIRDGEGSRAWATHEMHPSRRNTVVFDRRRRALVWQDAPAWSFSHRQTRELHFTTAPKLLRLPAVHRAAPGGTVTMRGLAAGALPLTWQWSHGTPVSAGTVHSDSSSSVTRSPLAAADAGLWQLSVSNAAGTAQAETLLSIGDGLATLPAAGGLWLAWPAGALETSGSPGAGPWSPVPGAVSPFYVPALETRGFFRIAAP